MIVVDTSVWVDALRRGEGSAARHLRDLLDADLVALAAPVRIEILAGASKADRRVLRRVLSALPPLRPDDKTWDRIDGWIDRAAGRGERFGFGDLLIGSLAADRGDAVWSLDDDLRRMARLGFVNLHDPAAWQAD